jgi:hypothetical protein
MNGLQRRTDPVKTSFLKKSTNGGKTKIRTVEGGQGQAQSYCAPQSASCAGGVVVQRSEQDWQASAHAALRRRLDAATFNPNGVYIFHFKTIYNDDPALAAAYVEYFSDPNEGSGFFEQIFK